MLDDGIFRRNLKIFPTIQVCTYDVCVNFTYRMFIKYCVFSKISKYILDSDLSLFFIGVYNWFHSWTTKSQVEDQCCSRTGRFQKNHNYMIYTHKIMFIFCTIKFKIFNNKICTYSRCLRRSLRTKLVIFSIKILHKLNLIICT